LGLWFHRTFKDSAYQSGPFIPPKPPTDESAELRAELERLQKAVSDYQTAHQTTALQLKATQSQLQAVSDERMFWEQMAAETEQAKSALQQRLAEQQTRSAAAPKGTLNQVITAANSAASAVELDEADTRKIIDLQLIQAGWEADSTELKYNKGVRPEKNRNRAIADLYLQLPGSGGGRLSGGL